MDIRIESIINKVLSTYDLDNMDLGRYEIDEDNYFVISSYMTKDESECKLESHKKYIDVQLLLSGEEKIKVADISLFKVKEEYNETSDCVFYYPGDGLVDNILKPGAYLVFLPNDAHMPGIMVGSPKEVKKVVIKIKI